MNPSELYQAGNLQEAIDAQIQVVKSKPAEQSERLFLFELLSFAGDLERAGRQVDAVNYGEIELDAAISGYRQLLIAEETRRKVFRDNEKPKFLIEPPEHVHMRVGAAARIREGAKTEAKELIAKADEAAPAIAGLLNDKPVESLRDCDDLFGPIIEVMAKGEYYWVPLEQVESLGMNPPVSPRDLIWFPAKLTVRDGPSGDVFLPVLYPFSHEHQDNQVKLGRLTDWLGAENEPVQGVGLRLFLAREDAMPVLDWRTVQLV